MLAVPRWLFCFGSLVVLDVVFRYLSLFLLYIDIKIGKIDVKFKTSRWPPVWETAVHLAVAGSVFDGVIESVTEGFLTYSFITKYADIFVEKMRDALTASDIF